MSTDIDYENPWTYNGEIFGSSDIQDYFGFVYHIHCNQTGRDYIGRKYFWSFRTPRGKSRKVKAESDWKKYYGSSDELKSDINTWGKASCDRRILSLHTTKGQCNYEETKQLFLNNVLTEQLTDGSPAFYNSNILGRYMKKDYYVPTSQQHS